MEKTIYTQHSILIREAIQRVREKAELSQRELCSLLDREHSFISKCELGERRIDIAEFFWICKACGASPKKEASALMSAFEKL